MVVFDGVLGILSYTDEILVFYIDVEILWICLRYYLREFDLNMLRQFQFGVVFCLILMRDDFRY